MAHSGEQQSHTHYIIATLLGILGLLIILVFVSIRSQADETTVSVSVTNSQPTVDNITVNTSYEGSAASATLSLGEGAANNASTTYYVEGDITDLNSCQEVTAEDGNGGRLWMHVYRSSATCSNTAATGSGNGSDNYCYYADIGASNASDSNASCAFKAGTCTGTTDTDVSYRCNVQIYRFADPTDASSDYAAQNWVFAVQVNDGAGAGNSSSSIQSTTREIATTSALNVDASLNFGSIALGATENGDSNTVLITNDANDPSLDAYINVTSTSAGHFTCDVGTFDGTSLKFASTTGVAFGSKTAVNSTTDALGHALVARESAAGAASTYTSNTYWGLSLPTPNNTTILSYGGNCTNTLIFTAYHNQA